MPPLPRTMALFLLLFLVSAFAPGIQAFHAGKDKPTLCRALVSAGTALAAPEEGASGRGEDPAPASGDAPFGERPSAAEHVFSGSALGALLFGYTFKGLGMLDIFLLAGLALVVFRLVASRRGIGGRTRGENSGRTGTRLQWPDKGGRRRSPQRDGEIIEANAPEEREDLSAPGRPSDPGSAPDAPREQRPHPTVRENAANAWALLRSAPAKDRDAQTVTPGEAAQAYRDMANLPPEVDVSDFLEGARALYIRLEEAWASRRLEDIAPFVTDGMMRLIREQAGRGSSPGRSTILFINAAMDSFTREESWEVAEVRFIVTMRESENGAEAGDPVEVREIWRIMRSSANGNRWQLDGIRRM